MLGYMNQNEATTETFDEDGWLLTGNELASYIYTTMKSHNHEKVHNMQRVKQVNMTR